MKIYKTELDTINYNEILEKNIRKKFGLKGEDIVNNNFALLFIFYPLINR